ncbi:MAG: hypothetical protein D6681_21065 [Calditrichaeota bacterium]|nr:MAG: hypothetical protein D6681_21065 [Calditrichota bacterium]
MLWETLQRKAAEKIAAVFGRRIQDNLLLAEPEKAAPDYIYLQRQNGLHPTPEEWNLEHLDLARLNAPVKRFPGTVVNHLSVLRSHHAHPKQTVAPGDSTGKKMSPHST